MLMRVLNADSSADQQAYLLFSQRFYFGIRVLQSDPLAYEFALPAVLMLPHYVESYHLLAMQMELEILYILFAEAFECHAPVSQFYLQHCYHHSFVQGHG